MDDLFDAKAGPLEKTRLQGVMMKWRSIFRGMTEAKGCAKVKQGNHRVVRGREHPRGGWRLRVCPVTLPAAYGTYWHQFRVFPL